MQERLWDFFVETLIAIFMPLVCCYHGICANVFLNVSVRDATGLEWAGNALLSPVQYILAGREATQNPDGSWQLNQRFDYNQGFWFKTASSLFALPSSLVLGAAVKGLSFMSENTRQHHADLNAALHSKHVESHFCLYQNLGLEIAYTGFLIPQGHERREGDENILALEKEALREIGSLLTKAQIPWWVDCGTCLGTYRYGGVIPWDCDIDIAVLLPDFENVRNVLNHLDPKKYIVQDWSSREHPKSYLKVLIRETGNLIDIYHFSIDPEAKQIQYIFSLENNVFFPEWWKIRERRFKAPVAFETVFPLKKSCFDGIEVFVPNDTEKYLQRAYGENLEPAKIYNPVTGYYEKNLAHPYWQRAYAH